MISIKGGTKTWSESPQRTDFESDRANTISAADREKYFGNQDLGEILNKVADPNWVDPSKKLRTVGDSSMDKDAFLKMLLTQMKNQDPTNPLKSHEMAAQLAQFTSLEKLTNISEGINALREDQKPSQNFEALNLIGKSVSIDASKLLRDDETQIHDVKFTLHGDPTSVELKIRDDEGNLIRKLQFNGLKEGENVVTWNGLLEDGTKASKGDYKVEVDAKSSNGSSLLAEMKTEGQITGVNFSANGPVLLVGDREVALKDVKKIVDPNIEKQRQNEVLKAAAQGPKPKESSESAPTKPVVKPEAKEEKVVAPGGLGSVAMSRGMQSELEKDGIDAGL